jgi:crotonobetainyl-CoA:carnitine CoA-transferase CaiB-like acyl-CoA transferase
MLIDMEHPRGGKMKMIGNPVKVEGEEEGPFSPSPLLGQHTEEVLSSLAGLSSDEIQELRREGVL